MTPTVAALQNHTHTQRKLGFLLSLEGNETVEWNFGGLGMDLINRLPFPCPHSPLLISQVHREANGHRYREGVDP